MAFCARKLFWAFDHKLCLDPMNMVDTSHGCSQSCSDRGVLIFFRKIVAENLRADYKNQTPCVHIVIYFCYS